MHQYVDDTFSEDEAVILRRYFTNLDGPVFALVNLPEVVKGALFARYSRSTKSLRRLFLDEFVGDLELSGDVLVDASVGVGRADELYQKVFFEYGDDSVAQLGGVHLACEQASNVLTKVLEWGRLMSYLEQSTRYLGYDKRLSNGRYRYYRDEEILASKLGARYVGEMDRVFDTYADLLGQLTDRLSRRYPKDPKDSDFAHRQAIRAKALDGVRGLLPASALSSVGIYGSGQGYEGLLLRMRAHPLPEVRQYADLMFEELLKVIPSFLRRVDVAERGVRWSEYFAATRSATEKLVADFESATPAAAPSEGVRLIAFDPDGERRVLEAIVFAAGTRSHDEAASTVARLTDDQKGALMRTYVGDRANRRHRPGRAFERTDYRFEIESDYGAFRDLQRHRLLTIEWQPLGADLGYDIPDVVTDAGLEDPYRASLDRSRDLVHALEEVLPNHAQYAVSLAFRIRYVIQMNAREAMHLIELRSGPQGHPSYRRVAQEMHRLIATQAHHPLLADAMSYTDYSSTDLERLAAERAAESARLLRDVSL
jgi:thymidylate synthase ThyX